MVASLSDAQWINIIKAIETLSVRYEVYNKVLSFFLIGLFRRLISHYVGIDQMVLEVGCGTGEFAKIVCSKAKYYCLDPSEKLLSIARRNIKCKNIIYVKGMAEELPFESEKFDRVYCVFAFRDFKNKVLSLREAYRVLRKGGLLVILDVQGTIFGRIYSRFLRFLGRILTLGLGENPFKPFDYSVWLMKRAEYYAKLAKKIGFRNVYILSIVNILFVLVAEK